MEKLPKRAFLSQVISFPTMAETGHRTTHVTAIVRWISCLAIGFGTYGANAADPDNTATDRNISAFVEVHESGFRRDLVTGELVQLLTLRNQSDETFYGELVIAGQFAGVDIQVAGKALERSKNGLQSVTLGPASDGVSLRPGERRVVVLRFRTRQSGARREELTVRLQSPRPAPEPSSAKAAGGDAL